MATADGNGSNSLTEREKLLLKEAIDQIKDQPPVIGLIGVSGVGKSSTINTMFKTDLPISHTVACTKEFRDESLQVQASSGPMERYSDRIELVVRDAPGLGEDLRKDPEYLDMYHQNLDTCDIILWILSARNRAIALDQIYLEKLEKFHDRIIFSLSQVDLIEPMEWKSGSPIPFGQQNKNIKEVVRDRGEKLSDFLGRKVDPIPYSNTYGYNLEGLFTGMLQSCTGNRSWIFSGLKNFSYEDFMPTKIIDAGDKKMKSEKPHGGRGESNEQVLPQANLADVSKGALKIFGDWMFDRFGSSPPAQVKPILREVIGRDDVEGAPLEKKEQEALAEWLRKERKQHGK